MLNGEGMQRRKMVKNNHRSNLRKSNFARAAHFFRTFLYRCLCTTSTWNFKKLLSYTFYGGNVHFFFTATHFHLALVAARISHFVTAATKFSRCSSNKINRCRLRFFIFRSQSLSPFFSLSFASPLSLFLCLSLALYSKFVDMTIYLSLII